MILAQRFNNFFQWIVGILLALGLFDLIYSFTGDTARYGNLYPAAHVLLNIVGFLALSFIWSKERWAAWLFLVLVALQMILDYFVGAFNPVRLFLFVPALFFLVMLQKDSTSGS